MIALDIRVACNAPIGSCVVTLPDSIHDRAYRPRSQGMHSLSTPVPEASSAVPPSQPQPMIAVKVPPTTGPIAVPSSCMKVDIAGEFPLCPSL